MLSIQYLSFNILSAGLTDTQSFLNPDVLIPIFGVLLPVLIILIVFVSDTKKSKYKYDALIEVSKSSAAWEELVSKVVGTPVIVKFNKSKTYK